jgi:predicted GIY-YIG superfamily endonuclease
MGSMQESERGCMSRRDKYRYELRYGRKIVYFGTTNDPERRVFEHVDSGKRFTHMNVVGPAVTRDSALDWEDDKLDGYARTHRGYLPRYNRI